VEQERVVSIHISELLGSLGHDENASFCGRDDVTWHVQSGVINRRRDTLKLIAGTYSVCLCVRLSVRTVRCYIVYVHFPVLGSIVFEIRILNTIHVFVIVSRLMR